MVVLETGRKRAKSSSFSASRDRATSAGPPHQDARRGEGLQLYGRGLSLKRVPYRNLISPRRHEVCAAECRKKVVERHFVREILHRKPECPAPALLFVK